MIGIIFVGDLKYCPYLDKYLKVCKEQEKDYEVLFWNRENDNCSYPDNYIYFNKKSELNRHPITKLADFIQFGVWVKNTIATKKYNRLIVLSTLSGIFIADILLKKYKKNYILDVRDYSYERYKPFYVLEEKLIRNSRFTCISSAGFKEFLPQNYEYIIAHNFNYSDLKLSKNFKKKEKGSVINFVWNGAVRYFDHQSHIISRLKNDSRFNVVYHGSGPELDKFKTYCGDNQINNVCFKGAYDNRIKSSLLENADILNNSYGTKNENKVKYAIANKYYDGLIYGIPQLVELNSFKHKKVSELGVGIGLDVYSKDFADQLYDYYFNVDEEKFNESCVKELNSILEEDAIYLNSIKEFIIG
jgi:hypothetical protein